MPHNIFTRITLPVTMRWKCSCSRLLLAAAAASVSLLGQAPAVDSVVNAVTNDTLLSPGAVAKVSGSFTGKPLVTVGGHSAYIFSSTANQIIIHVPIEVNSGVRELVVASENGIAISSVTLQAFAPGLVSANSSGTGVGSFTDKDGNPINAENPAHREQIITVSATGLGGTTRYLRTGEISADDKPTAIRPTLTVGGQPAQVLFAGFPATRDLALAGTYRITFVVPGNAPIGPDDVVLTIGGANSNTVTLLVTDSGDTVQ